MEDGAMEQFVPQHTLDFYVEKRNSNKRNYIFDYGESRTCDHPELKIIATGGIVYRCLRCNYAFHITGAYQQPLHNELLLSLWNVLYFSKEFGWDAVQEIVRRPIGQMDGSPHKPVLPEGMSFLQAVAALEEIDVNSGDGGAKQLLDLFDQKWVGKETRALYDADQQRRLDKAQHKRALVGGDNADADKNGTENSGGEGADVHPLQEG